MKELVDCRVSPRDTDSNRIHSAARMSSINQSTAAASYWWSRGIRSDNFSTRASLIYGSICWNLPMRSTALIMTVLSSARGRHPHETNVVAMDMWEPLYH